MNQTAKGDITDTCIERIKAFNPDDRSIYVKRLIEKNVEKCRNLDFFVE